VKIVYFSSKSAYEAKRTKLLKQAMIGVAVVGSGVVIYNWLSTPIPPKLPCPTIKEDSTCSELIKELLTESNENKKQIAAMHQGMVTAGILAPSNQGIVEWLLSWKPLFLNALMSTLVTASLSPVLKYFKIFDQAVDNIVGKVFYQNNLTWYLAHRAHLPAAFADLENLAERLDQGQAIASELETSWAILVRQVESILGYIDFRKKSLGSYVRERANEISHRIAEQVTGSATQLEQKSTGLGSSYKELIAVTRSKLDIQLRAFADIELIDLD
jgi:hypothetical protein